MYRRIASYSLRKHTFSIISDHELDEVVEQLTKDFPNCGESMIGQMLRGKGVTVQRFRQPRTQGLISAPRPTPTLAAKRPWYRLVTCHREVFGTMGGDEGHNYLSKKYKC